MADQSLDSAPVWDDVVTFDGLPWRGSVDLVVGGFPCQDLSVAGKRAGLDGGRSGLWREYRRIVKEVHPRYVFVENVSALVSRGLDRVLSDLADLGFDAEWGVFSAAEVGAPHLRKRLFLLAHSKSTGLEGRDLGNAGGSLANPDRDSSRSRRAGGSSSNGEGEPQQALSVADADCGRLQNVGSTGVDGERAALGDVVDRCGRAFPPGPDDLHAWDGPQPAVRRDADGASNRMERLRALGNGVVPQTARRAWVELWSRMINPPTASVASSPSPP